MTGGRTGRVCFGVLPDGLRRAACIRIQVEAERREPSGYDRRFQHPSPDGLRRAAFIGGVMEMLPRLMIRVQLAHGVAGELEAARVQECLGDLVRKLGVDAGSVCVVDDGPAGLLEQAAAGVGVGFMRLLGKELDEAVASIVVGESGMSGGDLAAVAMLASQVEEFRRECEARREIQAADVLRKLLPARAPEPFRIQSTLERWFRQMLRLTARRDGGARAAGDDVDGAGSARLAGMAKLRKCASDINIEADQQVKAMRRRLLWLALVVVFLLQCCQYWIPRFAAEEDLAAVNGWRLAAFVAGFVVFCGTWLYYARRRGRSIGMRQDEHRAIAESLRVQCYWTAAGIERSVAENYPLRQLEAMQYIRAVVSSVSMPLSLNRAEFDALSPEEQIARLRQIQRGWLAEQLGYFQRKAYELGVRQRWQSLAANGLLWGGVLQLCAGILADLSGKQAEISVVAAGYWQWLMCSVAAAVGVMWLMREAFVLIAGRSRNPAEPSHDDAFVRLVGRIERIAEHWGATAVFAVVTGVVLVAFAWGASAQSGWLPAGVNFNQVLRNLCFALSAFLHADMGFSFLSRNVAHYSSMAELYGERLKELQKLIGEFQAAAPERRPDVLRQIRRVLEQLGGEAIDENSDWLQMHRAAPVGPVSLGW